MKYFAYLGTAFAAFASGSTSFRLGPKRVSVALTGGAPVHLSVGAAFLAVEKVLANEDGTFVSGSVSVTIGPWEAPA